MNRIFTLASAFAAATALAAPANAGEGYDGTWQVTIVTEQGTCGKAFSYPLAVKGGTVSSAGYFAAKTAGTVEGSGLVKVSITMGDKNALGTGRLTGDAGAGTWKGGACSGRWKASRKVVTAAVN